LGSDKPLGLPLLFSGTLFEADFKVGSALPTLRIMIDFSQDGIVEVVGFKKYSPLSDFEEFP
jgi:hypothetical protein